MSKLYIGISGKMGSGKTTLTNNIIKALSSLKCEVVSMAKPIKDVQHLIYKELGLELEGEKDRPLLIALGLWGRDKDADLWRDAAVKKMEESSADIVICDDVRFPNEADWFKENGILLRITGEQRGENVDESAKKNISETALDSYAFRHRVTNILSEEHTALTSLAIITKELGLGKELVEGLKKKGA